MSKPVLLPKSLLGKLPWTALQREACEWDHIRPGALELAACSACQGHFAVTQKATRCPGWGGGRATRQFGIQPWKLLSAGSKGLFCAFLEEELSSLQGCWQGFGTRDPHDLAVEDSSAAKRPWHSPQLKSQLTGQTP